MNIEQGSVRQNFMDHSDNSTSAFDAPKTDDDCPICLEKLSDQNCVNTRCNHLFHEMCILTCFNEGKKCPLCRVKLILPFETWANLKKVEKILIKLSTKCSVVSSCSSGDIALEQFKENGRDFAGLPPEYIRGSLDRIFSNGRSRLASKKEKIFKIMEKAARVEEAVSSNVEIPSYDNWKVSTEGQSVLRNLKDHTSYLQSGLYGIEKFMELSCHFRGRSQTFVERAVDEVLSRSNTGNQYRQRILNALMGRRDAFGQVSDNSSANPSRVNRARRPITRLFSRVGRS